VTSTGLPGRPLSDRSLADATGTARAGYAGWVAGIAGPSGPRAPSLSVSTTTCPGWPPAPTISTSRAWPKNTPATTPCGTTGGHLLAERKASPATAKLALVAIDSFYAWLGLGAPDVTRVAIGRRLLYGFKAARPGHSRRRRGGLRLRSRQGSAAAGERRSAGAKRVNSGRKLLTEPARSPGSWQQGTRRGSGQVAGTGLTLKCQRRGVCIRPATRRNVTIYPVSTAEPDQWHRDQGPELRHV
jgi:hypothetical protein